MFRLISYTLLTVLTADILATVGDITVTWTSPTLPKLCSNDSKVNPFEQPINANEKSWIGSLVNIGAIIGPFPYGFIAKTLGRKVSLLCVAVPHIVSFLTLSFSTSVYLYYFARLLGGLALGGSITVLPMYLAEISEDCNRGMFSATMGTFLSLGSLIPYVIGPFTSVFWMNIIFACVPVLFFGSFFTIAPESPYFLVMKGKLAQAEKALIKLRSRNKQGVVNEIVQIQLELQKNTTKVTLTDFFKSKIYMKGLFISLVLMMAQQLSGINAVLFYAQEIFEEIGATSLKPEISAIIIGSVYFFSSIGTPFVADKLGRRLLLLVSFVGETIALVTFGIYFYLKMSTNIDVDKFFWLPVCSLVVFILSFNVGIGPLVWTISSELFPTNVKSYAARLVSITCFICSFLVTKFFGDLRSAVGTGATFWLFAGVSVIASIFTFFCVPETKKKSFQEIQEILEHKFIR